MWEHLLTFNLTNNWQTSEQITSTIFKVIHTISNYSNQSQIAQIALINDNTTPIEIYQIRRVLARPEAEIIQFSGVPGWSYKLGARQILLPGMQPLDWTIYVQAANFESQSEKNMTSVSNNIIFGNGQPQELPQETKPKYKHFAVFKNATSAIDGEWFDTIDFDKCYFEFSILPEEIDYSNEDYTVIEVSVSNSIEKPSNSEHGRQTSTFVGNTGYEINLYSRWLKVRISRYKAGDFVTCVALLR